MHKLISYENTRLTGINDLIDHAWYQAIKYKFDPVVGRIHQEYLDLAKQMKSDFLNESENNQNLSYLFLNDADRK